MSDTVAYAASAAVIGFRIVQATLSVFALTFILGPILGDMTALSYIVLGPVAIVCLLFALMVEIPVRSIKGRWGSDPEI